MPIPVSATSTTTARDGSAVSPRFATMVTDPRSVNLIAFVARFIQNLLYVSRVGRDLGKVARNDQIDSHVLRFRHRFDQRDDVLEERLERYLSYLHFHSPHLDFRQIEHVVHDRSGCSAAV